MTPHQPNLFETPVIWRDRRRPSPPPATPPQDTGHAGLLDGHAAAEVAAAHAGEVWGDAAFCEFVAWATTHPTFTTEDVRYAPTSTVGEPPDRRAWGAVALRAARAGVVKGIGLVRTLHRQSHGRFVTQWESNMYRTRQ